MPGVFTKAVRLVEAVIEIFIHFLAPFIIHSFLYTKKIKSKQLLKNIAHTINACCCLYLALYKIKRQVRILKKNTIIESYTVISRNIIIICVFINLMLDKHI